MDLFDDDNPTPARPEPQAAIAPREDPRGLQVRRFHNIPWRKPHLPFEQPCAVCQGAAPCGVGNQWFCLNHVPLDYFPPR